MSTALAPYGYALPARRAKWLSPSPQFRSGAGLQTAAGSVTAFFALESFDRRRGVAKYVLRVINRSRSTLICRTWILADSGEMVLAYPALVEVEPCSTRAALVPVWPRDFPSFDRAIAEIVGEDVHCIVEASAPPQRKHSRVWAIVAGASFAAGVLAIGAGGALSAAIPRIDALAVAPQAPVGTTVEAQYSVAGSGNLSYVVTAPDGARVAGGALGQHTGSIFIPIPGSSQPGAYSVRLAMDGPLGRATDTRIVNAEIPRAQAAQIADISVKPMVVKPGQTVEVAYAAQGDAGYVRLVGTDGTIWAQQPYSHGGQTELVVPPVAGQREMHVLLHVTQGRSSAQSVAGILVGSPVQAAALNRTEDSAAPIAGDDDPAMASADDAGSDANGTFAVRTRTVRAGANVAVRILSPRNGMRVALMDPQSHEITGQDVGADADVVTLRAPQVAVATRYTVVATFTDGFGQESIVQPITVKP